MYWDFFPVITTQNTTQHFRTGFHEHFQNVFLCIVIVVKKKGKGHPCTGTEALYPGKDPVSIVQEAGWAPGSVWTGAENLAPTGIRSPDRPARSQSLYRLSHPAPVVVEISANNYQ